MLKPTKADPQGMGSAVTYARRYSYMAIIGLAAEDDDGNAASRQGAKAPQAIERPAARQGNGVQMEAKRKAYFAQAAKLGVEGEAAKTTVKEMFGLEHFTEATVEQLRDAYTKLKERVAA